MDLYDPWSNNLGLQMRNLRLQEPCQKPPKYRTTDVQPRALASAQFQVKFTELDPNHNGKTKSKSKSTVWVISKAGAHFENKGLILTLQNAQGLRLHPEADHAGHSLHHEK